MMTTARQTVSPSVTSNVAFDIVTLRGAALFSKEGGIVEREFRRRTLGDPR